MKSFLYISLLLSSFSFAQNRHSSAKNDLINDFSSKRNEIEVFTTKYPDSAFIVATKMVQAAKLKKNEQLQAIAYSALAFVQITKTNLIEAEHLINYSIRINKKNNWENELAISYNYLGLIKQRQSDFVKASKYFFESVHLAEKQKNYNLIQRNYNGISMLFCDQDNFKKALYYAKKSNEIIKFNHDYQRHAFSNAILAEVYREMGNIELAEFNFTQSYFSYKKLNDDFGQAWCLTNWSIIYDTMEMVKVIEMELEAQRIWDKSFPDNVMSMTNLGNLGWSLFVVAQNQELINSITNPEIPKTKAQLLNLSEYYYTRCLEIAKRKNNLNTLLFFSGSLAELQAYKGDLKSAYENLTLNKHLTDSLFSQDNKNKIATIESEKELQAKQDALEINQLKLASSENQKWFFIGGLFLFAIIITLLIYQSRLRRKSNLMLEKTNLELAEANNSKAKLFGIINHDLRTPVASLVSFLNLQQMHPELLDKETQSRLMTETLTSTEHLLTTMEDLLQWSKGQMKNFKTTTELFYINELFQETQNFFIGIKVDIKFQDAEKIKLTSDKNYLKTILRNLTANAINALGNTENPSIYWTATYSKDEILLTITDNGPGINKEQVNILFDDSETAGINKGLGLHIVRDMAKAIECSIEWNDSYKNGTQFILKFKK